MQKQAPKLIAISLLITLAALMAVAAWIPEKESTSSLAGEQGNEFKPDPDPPADDNEQETPPAEEPVVPFTPIPPEASALYRYTQSLWAEGGVELNGVHQTSEGTFAVITHSGKEGALNVGGKRTLSVVKLESDGTVSALKHLAGGDVYLDSRLTSDGLAVAACDDGRSYIHTLSLDLKSDVMLELNRFTSAELFALSDGYLLFTSGTDNNVYAVSDNVVKATGSVIAGEIFAVYDFAAYYMLVIGGISGYSVVKIDISDASLRTLSTVTIPDKQILNVSPYVENGVQKFLAVEKNANGVEVVKYDASFTVDEERVGVGLADAAEAYMNGNSILLLLHATSTRLYIIDGNLNFTASNSDLMRGVTSIHDCICYENGYVCLYSAGDKLTMCEIGNDGKTVTRNLAVTTSAAYLTRDTDGKCAVFYASDDSLKIIGV